MKGKLHPRKKFLSICSLLNNDNKVFPLSALNPKKCIFTNDELHS
jgi:hypothetical protein